VASSQAEQHSQRIGVDLGKSGKGGGKLGETKSVKVMNDPEGKRGNMTKRAHVGRTQKNPRGRGRTLKTLGGVRKGETGDRSLVAISRKGFGCWMSNDVDQET